MTSTFAWLDNDDTQQRQMNQLIELFKDESTVDELGIGTIRDTFANELFPGTSVLQTRARYFLFTAWLVREVARKGLPAEAAVARLRADEVRLIDSLLAGGERDGVIGNQARSRLKRMPSEAYWAGLGRFGLRTWDLSIAAHLRAASSRANRASEDLEELGHRGPELGLDASLPATPEDLLTSTTFALTPEDSAYLTDRIAVSAPESLFAWLALHGEVVDTDLVWLHPQASQFPAVHRALVDHARRFHHAIYGAAVLYNLMLAEKRGDADLSEDFRAQMADWENELRSERVFEGWSRDEFWVTVSSLNRHLRPATRAFVDEWLRLAEADTVADDPKARALIRNREIRLKGGRARLTNPAALDSWSERAGLVRLDYRWGVAARHLRDIHSGREVR